MFLNVWGFIWPDQKIALGIVEADADAKAKAGRKAMIFSRINTLLSLPMLAMHDHEPDDLRLSRSRTIARSEGPPSPAGLFHMRP